MKTLTFKLSGQIETREVQLNGKPLGVSKSLKVINHSPDGFSWGYGGSEPAQLALAVLLELMPTQHEAYEHHQRLKWEDIATLPQTDFEKEITFIY